MKAFCLASFCLGLVLAGCSHPDPRLAALETTVAAQGAEISQLRERLEWQRTNLLAVMDRTDAGLADLKSRTLGLMEAALAQNERITLAAESLRTNRSLRYWPANAPAPVGGASVPASRSPLTNGVPVAVYHQLLAAAQKEWPGDFRMQAHELKQQLEAWQKLHPY